MTGYATLRQVQQVAIVGARMGTTFLALVVVGILDECLLGIYGQTRLLFVH